MDRRQRIPLRTTMVPDSFKVLPPLSPELPAPPPAPKPVRVAPLTVSRRDESAFVILAESNSRTTSPAPVSGRVSPFRAHGFKTPAGSRHPSRDPSPNRSRSRLPVARPTGRSSVSSSPARKVSTSVPKPVIRRNSLSPNRATKVMTQVSRNKSFVSSKNTQNLNVPVNKANITSPQRRLNKQSPKRVGPLNVKNENSNLIISKPPIPKTAQKKVDAGNVKQNNLPNKRQNISNIKSGTVLQSPSRIPRGQKVNPGQNISPTKKPPPKVKPKPTPQPRSKVNESISRPPSTNHDKTIDQSSNVDSKQKGLNKQTPIGFDHDKSSRNVVEEVKHDSEKQNVDETLVKYSRANHSTESEPNKSNDSEHDYPEVTSSDGLSIKSKVTITSLPDEDMTETSLTLVRTTTAPALELAQPDVIPNILSTNLDKIDSDKVETFGKITVDKMLDKIENKSDEMELRHVEIKEKVMKVDNNAATDNILQTVPAQSDNIGLTGLSVESVRSTSSVETVRAVAKVKVHLKKHEEDVKGSIKEDADAEVLSANNLISTDSINNNSNNRTVAWENTTPGEASVYPVEPIIVQPPKPKGCCGKFLDKISCKCCKTSPPSDKKYSGCFGKFCNKLNCCKKSSCCKKQKEERPKPIPPSRQKKSKLKECLSRLNCCRSIKCCKKTQRPLEEDNEDVERPPGCCAGCKTKTKKCGNALFCMNLSCCQKLRLCSGCTRFDCCRSGGCCGPSPPDLDRRKSRQSLKRSQTTSMIGLPKLDSTLVEHTAFIRGAIPVLPVPLAWICLIFNVFLPGVGTLLSGMFCLCVGKPRFSINDSHADRLKAFCINIIIAVAQVFSIIFCLVGWGWSIWWGVIMLRLAKKNRRIQLAEKNTEQPVPVALNQNHDVERAR